jgi:hypothetical protein
MTDQKMQDAKRSDRSAKMIKLLTLPGSERGHIHGSDEGSIRLLEYGDYECPYCGLRVHVLRSGPTDRQGDTARYGKCKSSAANGSCPRELSAAVSFVLGFVLERINRVDQRALLRRWFRYPSSRLNSHQRISAAGAGTRAVR